MILRKPYAFFIKIFKPIHIVMSVMIMYLIYISNNILRFFSNYINSPNDVMGENIKQELISTYMYIIPVVSIVLSLIFLGIMYNKKKPFTFYIVNIFSSLVILIINIYTLNFIGIMEKSITPIKIVKLNHDLILISMILQIILFIFLMIRGLGINFKKFNFDSDINKLNISESDKEEFELSINVDFDDAKRRRKRKIRELKYLYKENKIIINLIILFILVLATTASIYIVLNLKKVNTEGIVYNMNKFNIKINKTLILNESFNGKKLTDNYLIVVDTSLQSNLNNISLFLKDFSLQVEDITFSVQKKYTNDLADLGISYDETNLNSEYQNFIFVFEVPIKYIKSDFDFVYNQEGRKTKIRIKPQNIVSEKINISKKITEKINFIDSIGDISFNIKNIDIQDYYSIKYNYCVSKNDCLLSTEYIRPTINENFDKTILKLEVEYFDNSDLNTKGFYDFFSRFGTVYYKNGGSWYNQRIKFEELRSKKTNNKNNIYIGVNSDIKKAESIKIVFDIRNSRYEYVLK